MSYKEFELLFWAISVTSFCELTGLFLGLFLEIYYDF